MARPIVLSNGSLHVGINNHGFVHDFYYPHVGLENHSAGEGSRHKVGVWVDGKISWLDDGTWKTSFKTADYTLLGHTAARNDKLGILLEFDDFVSSDMDAFMRNIHIVNLQDSEREVRLFMHQAFVIGDTRSNTDTAQYLPDSDAILHYHGRRAFIISGKKQDGQFFDQHSIGLFGIEGHEGTYRDADDGELSGGNVEHGRVDSTLRFVLRVPAKDSARVQYWIAAGTSTRDALDVHKSIINIGLLPLLHATAKWWHEWLEPTFVAAEKISPKRRQQFIKSVMMIRSQIDNDGGVIASTDTTMLNYSRDAYAYCWPRDGAYAIWPLIRIGYTEEPKKFFAFCKETLHPAGYLMHKYQADGALGSSWHPYVHGSTYAPPIQEDETALVLFIFTQYYNANKDAEYLEEYYKDFVVPMADFLASYIDDTTGLPRPSYDLWEENFLTTTYSTAVVYAALGAASSLAEACDDKDAAVRWRSSAEDIKAKARKYFYNSNRCAFYKGLQSIDNELQYDDTIDVSSFYGAFMFGLYEADDKVMKTTLATIERLFLVSKDSPCVPRYENDDYQRSDNSALSNLWYISSLWLAQYAIETDNIGRAEEIINWIDDRLDETGMMSEQLDPITKDAVSVSPLTWSHAEYVSTLLDMPMDTKS